MAPRPSSRTIPAFSTFSIDGAKNFPLHKERSDLDVNLPDGTGDVDYLDALEISHERSLALACADLAIYLAGADPFVRAILAGWRSASPAWRA